jgi:hypothetical protein
MIRLDRNSLLTLAIIVASAVVAGCGGGGGGGGVIAGGGIGGTGISASGAISGFGSIFVTENEFEIVPGTTTVSGDDNPNASQDDLSLGMVVTVRGTIDANGTITATSVDYDADVEGPIADVPQLNADGTGKTFTVLGTTVFVSANDTVFDDGPGSAITFDTIAQGDFIEASGYFDDNGDLQASFIERQQGVVFVNDVTEVEAKGIVSNLVGNSFDLGSLTVNFDGATDLTDLPGGVVTEDLYVEVKGTLPAANSTILTATKIELEGLDADEGDTEIEGIVSDFNNLASFKVAGQPVDASGAGVQFEPATLTLANDLEVEVEGNLAGGILVADTVKLRGGSIEVEATVAAAGVNQVARTVTLGPLGRDALNLTVVINDATRLETDSGLPAATPPFGLDDIADGDFLEVEAFDDGNGNLVATRIKRDDVDDFILQGPTDAAPDTQNPNVSILGIIFDTTGLGDTEFQDENDVQIGRGPFFARAEPGGELVKVKDNDLANGTPDQVEFEN